MIDEILEPETVRTQRYLDFVEEVTMLEYLAADIDNPATQAIPMPQQLLMIWMTSPP